MSTSKSGPRMVCFVRFGLDMCFSRQRRAIFNRSAPAALASLLFNPPEPRNNGKAQVFRDFLTFSRTWIFFLLTVSSLILFLLLCASLLTVSSLILVLLLFSYSSHLCFSSVHIVGSLTSKLPSAMTIHILVSRYFSIPYIIIGETNTLKIKQTTLSDKLEPQICGLEWCSFKKNQGFQIS